MTERYFSLEEAWQRLANHTLYYVPEEDMWAFKMALNLLEEKIELENSSQPCVESTCFYNDGCKCLCKDSKHDPLYGENCPSYSQD